MSEQLPAPVDPPTMLSIPPGMSEIRTGKLIVIEQVVHRHPKMGTVSDDCRFAVTLSTDEQPWGPRMVKVGEAWQQVDLGWLGEAGASMVLIKNVEGKFLQVTPTEEERAASRAKVVEVSTLNLGPAWLIPPGQCFRGIPSGSAVWLRCQKGVAECQVTVYPK